MWISRDLSRHLADVTGLPVKILKGPRQSGKTSFLERLDTHRIVYLDDAAVRRRAQDDPRGFLDSFSCPVVLDEAPLAPALFPELKRRVDQGRRKRGSGAAPLDIWVTGSNQTLLRGEVRESLAGRATYLDLNTLSAHELSAHRLQSNDPRPLGFDANEYLIKGGWPELYATPSLSPIRYLNDLIATFIERDIVSAAGIQKKAAFTRVLQLAAGRVGQLMNASELASAAGVEVTTVQSWLSILVDNGVLLHLPPHHSNLNKRLLKSPKIFFMDTGLATRLQGWSELQPLLSSPLVGHLRENMVVGEVARCFLNRGLVPEMSFVRSKEKVEIDLLVHLPNQRTVAIEVKTTPQELSPKQTALLDSLGLDIVDRWIVAGHEAPGFRHRVLRVDELWDALAELW